MTTPPTQPHHADPAAERSEEQVSEMKHTQGNWSVGVYEITPTMRERLERPQSCVCLDDDGKPGMVIALCGDAEDRQSQVDADLIAAAPDLLVSLKRAANAVAAASSHVPSTMSKQMDLAWSTAQDAIAKAEGQPVKEHSNT